MSESASLSSNPQVVLSACEGVNAIHTQPLVSHTFTRSMPQPMKSTFEGSKPYPPSLVDIDGATTYRSLFDYRVTNECAVAQSLNVAHSSNPQVSLSILKQRCYWRAGPAATSVTRDPLPVDSK